jgi:F0F1-type ATP synthase assembly protein I
MTYYTLDDHHELTSANHHPIRSKTKDVTRHIAVDGMYFAAPILLCLAIGLIIDAHYGTKPYGTAFFLVAGSIGSFYNVFVLIRSTKQPTHDKTNTPQ